MSAIVTLEDGTLVDLGVLGLYATGIEELGEVIGDDPAYVTLLDAMLELDDPVPMDVWLAAQDQGRHLLVSGLKLSRLGRLLVEAVVTNQPLEEDYDPNGPPDGIDTMTFPDE